MIGTGSNQINKIPFASQQIALARMLLNHFKDDLFKQKFSTAWMFRRYDGDPKGVQEFKQIVSAPNWQDPHEIDKIFYKIHKLLQDKISNKEFNRYPGTDIFYSDWFAEFENATRLMTEFNPQFVSLLYIEDLTVIELQQIWDDNRSDYKLKLMCGVKLCKQNPDYNKNLSEFLKTIESHPDDLRINDPLLFSPGTDPRRHIILAIAYAMVEDVDKVKNILLGSLTISIANELRRLPMAIRKEFLGLLVPKKYWPLEMMVPLKREELTHVKETYRDIMLYENETNINLLFQALGNKNPIGILFDSAREFTSTSVQRGIKKQLVMALNAKLASGMKCELLPETGRALTKQFKDDKIALKFLEVNCPFVHQEIHACLMQAAAAKNARANLMFNTSTQDSSGNPRNFPSIPYHNSL